MPRRSPRNSSGGVGAANNVAPSPLAETPSKQTPLNGAQATEKENAQGATPNSVRIFFFFVAESPFFPPPLPLLPPPILHSTPRAKILRVVSATVRALITYGHKKLHFLARRFAHNEQSVRVRVRRRASTPLLPRNPTFPLPPSIYYITSKWPSHFLH